MWHRQPWRAEDERMTQYLRDQHEEDMKKLREKLEKKGLPVDEVIKAIEEGRAKINDY
jgi:hypothetical protein